MKPKRSTSVRLAGVALIAIIGGTIANPASACSSRLAAVQAEWRDMSFLPPSKPSQARVVGRDGREITAGQYSHIHGQIRRADRECRSGQTASAERRADHARGVLARAAGPAPTGTGPFIADVDAVTIVE